MAIYRDNARFAGDVGASLPRRAFLKLAGVAGGGLVLSMSLASLGEAQQAPAAPPLPPLGPGELNAYVQVRPDGKIRIYNPNPEIGQGVKTSLPLMIAEELDAAWADVIVEQSPIGPQFGPQFAGGSLAVPMRYMMLRQVGAAARSMLVAAAAEKWGVDAATLTTADSKVANPATGESLTYGELAEAAAAKPAPDPATITLKDKSQFKLFGTHVTGVDNAALVTGKPLFGIDTIVPGMKHAFYVRAPRLGSKVKSANLDEIKALPGVSDAFVIEGLDPASRTLVPGVAIVTESTWSAFQAAKKVKVEWDETTASTDTTDALLEGARTVSQGEPEQVLGEVGDFAATYEAAPTKVEAFYDYPFLYHSPLEPMNCTAVFQDGKMEIWAPTQLPGSALGDVATATGLQQTDITLHVTRIGGGFGRRLFNDFVCEAAAIAQRVPGTPVKLTYTREEDTTHGLYRPAGYHRLKGAVDAEGKLVGWQNHFVTFNDATGSGAIGLDEFPMPMMMEAGLNARLGQTFQPLVTRTAAFRAPSSNGKAFATQSFFHELSAAAGRDHKEFLRELLGEPRDLAPPAPPGGGGRRGGGFGPPAVFNTGRMAGCINAACDAAGWGREMAPRSGLGLAFYYSHQGHVAVVTEVAVDVDKKVSVKKVWVAADVGQIVNQSAALNQCEGAALDGIGIAANLKIDIVNGAIQQTSFHNYPLIRMPSAPPVEVIFIASDFPPSGLGEPVLPPVMPALCNAIFAATGERIRSLPFSQQGFTI